MKTVFAYIRVSTAKQGQQGSSLHEQRDAINAYAQRHGLSIIQWFEETETAATQGRRAFGGLLDALTNGKARGVIIHKIDRSARNLKDWANLGDLIDGGVEIHFAHESIDLTSRGGRLSADIQAVVAADFIRNLRQETRKGFYGRVKQGLYPLRAPIGYRDVGRGQVKTLDPNAAPLIRTAFELYSSGEFNFDELRAELTRRGLRNRGGRPITNNGLTTILNNPFYMGLIHLRKTNEIFQGAHPPIITKALYDNVQAVLRGKRVSNAMRHDRLASRLIRCVACNLNLIGETQKGRYVYYRCHTKGCNASVSERSVEQAISDALAPLSFDAADLRDFRDLLDGLKQTTEADNRRIIATLELRISETDDRLARLTDAYIDGVLEKELFESRKRAALESRRGLRDQLEAYQSGAPLAEAVAADLELVNTAYSVFQTGYFLQKRAMLNSVTSNFTCSGKSLAITLKSPFEEVRKAMISSKCDLRRDEHRTRAARTFEILLKAAEEEARKRHSPDHGQITKLAA